MPFRLRLLARRQHGFTLIELLVVILIVGILAAIAIPVFLGQRERAQDAAAKNDARSAHTAVLSFHIASGSYDADVADLAEIEPALAGARDLTVTGTDGPSGTFRLSVASRSGHTFGIEQIAAGTVRRFCTPAGKAGCSATGSW